MPIHHPNKFGCPLGAKFYGTELNIIKRERLELPLVRLIEETYRVIKSHIKDRSVLVDLFFEQRLEYPTFAWQEAIMNAVAHRDYSIQGTSVEIWMFDDHIDVRSPGDLVEPVTLERLLRRERTHVSRNPLIVRVLTDSGYMRDLVEGIPRMFETMEQPEFRLEGGFIFTITLRNQPIYSEETMRWLAQFKPLRLSGDQKRILAFAKECDGSFTSRDFQKLTSADIYTASKDIKELVRMGIVRHRGKGNRIYELTSKPQPSLPDEAKALVPVLLDKGFVKNEDLRRVWGTNRLNSIRRVNDLVSLGLLRRKGKGRGIRYLAEGRLQDELRNVST